MNYRELYENKRHGTVDFPFELYRVGKNYPRYQMPFHWHVEYEMIYVKSGHFNLIVDGRSYTMAKGDCAWIGSGAVHGGIPDDCEYYCLVFDLASLFKGMTICSDSLAAFLASADLFDGIYDKNSFSSAIIKMIFDKMDIADDGYDLCVIGLLWQLIGLFMNDQRQKRTDGKKTGRNHKFKEVFRYIRKNIDQNITLDALADLTDMSPRYFCRAFKKMTGKTPIEYVNYYRIETAGELLLISDASVTDIALNCGFNDMSYFSKTFRRLKGQSPSSYRRSLNK